MGQDAYDHCTANPKVFKKLLEDAEKPLYPGCTKFTKLSTLVKLYNFKTTNSLSHTGFSDLLTLLSDMLPLNNEIPSSMYEAGKTFAALGMGYGKIHACPYDCILYRKEYKDTTSCPTCGTSRWKLKKNSTEIRKDVPAKVLWYFPSIPRFQRMFQSAKIAKDMTWHAHERDYVGTMCHPADSPSWKLVDHKWPDFIAEPRNLRLAISTDGINPHSSLSSRYSCWPVIMITYNLPPWLCMKKKFMMLSLLISGPQQLGNDIDVYLAPLIDDLKMLWEVSVEAYGAYKKEHFRLKAILLWTINDFPALGNLSGCTVRGYYACPICREGTCSHRLKYGKKNTYVGHRKLLPRYHPCWRQKKAFNGEQEFGLAPIPLTGEEILNKVEGLVTIWGKKNKKTLHVGGTKCWKKKSLIFDLEYWKYLHVRHNLDVMHIEKNVCESLIGTLLNIPGKTKDGINSCLDLVEMGLREELAPQIREKRTYLPPACYTLSKEEKRRVCTTLLELKVPEGHYSNLGVVKVVDVGKLDEIQKDLVVTLCLLEKYLPPSFLNIMVHLTVHLVREVRLCGPVHFRWMCQFERFMKILKGYVRNRNCPEGCIAESYIVEETVEFCAEYLFGVDAIGIPSNRNMTDNDDIEIGRPLLLIAVNGSKHIVMAHMAWLKLKYHRQSQSQKWLQIEHNKTFMYWLHEKVSKELSGQNNISNNLKWIAQGPRLDVIKFPGYIINGCRYHTKDQDNSRVSQNSGVSLVATTMHVTGYKDKNPVFTDMSYYGVIIEIWQLDYNMFKIPVFKCDWVDNTKGIKVDELGFTLVELGKIGHKDNPFILASQAKQVFYVQDQLDPRWSVVLEPPQKQYSCEKDDEFNDFCIEHHGFTKVLPKVESLDVVDDSMSSYMRGDCKGTWLDNP
ncbi:uncharacterized protein LOC114282405 [Camellia sinensis]|uniref:uncharacterized protein LOC114282405 n=1 Tax=Camellia sinensis TaxID=4442 RepID=UPI001036EF32|nr:uncharacterized protein LOC114282405 [Camellia sinensis]